MGPVIQGHAMKSVLLHTHLFIALCAVALTWGSQMVLGLPPLPMAYYGIVGLGTLCVYNLHRAYGVKGLDPADWSSRFTAFYRLRYVNLAMSFLAAGIVGWLLLTHPEFWTWILFPPVVLAILYILPLKNGRSLRQIPFLKIFIIASTWIWVTGYLPVWLSGAGMDVETSLFLTHRFLFIFAITIPFDIRDVYTDQISHVQTLPSYYGIERSKDWAAGLLVASFLVLLPLFFLDLIRWEMLFVYLGVSAGGLTLIRLSSPKRSEYYFGYILDGLILVLGGLEVLVAI